MIFNRNFLQKVDWLFQILQGEMNELRNENVKLQAEEERRAYFQEEHKVRLSTYVL